MWRGKEKHGAFQKQASSIYHLNFLEGIAFSPLLHKKDKAEQQLSYPKVLRDYLDRKYTHCWGLPSLHSESLVATAVVTGATAQSQDSSVLFNGNSTYFPLPSQPIMSSSHSHTTFRPHCDQLQHSAGNFLQAQHPLLSPVQTLAHPTPHLLIQSPLPPPQTGYCGMFSPTGQSKAETFIPNNIQSVEWSLWQTQQEKMSLSPVVQNSDQAFNPVPTLLFEDSYTYQADRSVSVFHENHDSGVLQEPNLQRWLLRGENQEEMPHRIQNVETIQPQGETLGPSHTSGRQQPSLSSMLSSQGNWDVLERSYVSPRRSNSKNNLLFRQRTYLNKGLGQCLRRVPKDHSKRSAISSVSSEGLQRHPMRPEKCDSGSCLSRRQEKRHLEKLLKAHLGKKVRQINKGLFPVSVRRSWLASNLTLSKPSAQKESTKSAPFKRRESHTNTSRQLPFLRPCAQQELEAHMIRFRVRQKWGSCPNLSEPINIKECESQPLFSPRPVFPYTDTFEPETQSKAPFAQLVKKTTQSSLQKKGIAKKSYCTPILGSPFLTSKLANEETERSPGGSPPVHGQELSKFLLTKQEAGPPAQMSVSSPLRKPQQRKVETGNLLTTTRAENITNSLNENRGLITPDLSHKIEILKRNLDTKSLRVKQDLESIKTKETPAWEVNVGPRETDTSWTDDMYANSSQSSVSHDRFLTPAATTAPNPSSPDLTTIVTNKCETQGAVELENLPQGCATVVIPDDSCTEVCLLDYGTKMVIQGCAISDHPGAPTNVLLAVNILDSYTSLCQEKDTSGNTPAPQEIVESILSGHDSQGQQETRRPEGKIQGKSQRKIVTATVERVDAGILPAERQNVFTPSNERKDIVFQIKERKDYRKSKSREQEKRFPGVRTLQANDIGHPAQVEERADIQGSKTLQEKESVSTESHLRKRMRHFLECLKFNKKSRGPHEHLQKAKAAPAAGQRRQGVKSKLSTDRATVEAQMIASAVEHVLVRKLGLSKGTGASQVKQNKQKCHVPMVKN
ncbi:PREDICTED: spermatogenesis-associated protein 31E1-like [Condylura cristata]|uniref:spermatogenesis-associated protein 31E1-like n=1 Tax=Condylura cristata TaxID=143302 RepID=UPI00033435E9|nr:PREDICTED: spermatogenesis-associated protein 31E1-like [Condylura cristata]